MLTLGSLAFVRLDLNGSFDPIFDSTAKRLLPSSLRQTSLSPLHLLFNSH